MTIYEKLNAIQTGLHAPKGQRNDFGKYNYRSCEDILEALKPLLKATQTIVNISDDIVVIGDRIYIKAVATISDYNGGTVSATAFAREEETKKGMDSSQVTGAASSYARKYALNGLLAIDDNKDSDATNESVKDTPPMPKEKKAQEKKPPVKQEQKQDCTCSVCRKQIVEYRNRSAEAWIDYTTKTFGRQMCGSCGMKMIQEKRGEKA